MEVAVRRTNECRESLKGLPPEGRGVKATLEELNKAIEDGNAAAAFLVPLNKKLGALMDPANYPELNADINRLRELCAMFSHRAS